MDAASEGDPAAAEALREALPSLRSAAEAGGLEAQEVLGGVLLEWAENPAEVHGSAGPPSAAAPWASGAWRT